MSKVRYFASDAPLKEKKNPYVNTYSINQAVSVGIDLDMDLLDGIDKDEPDMILWMESEDCAEFPSIWTTEPYSEAPKSEKKYYAEIGGSPDKDLKGIVEYIQDHMKKKKGENTRDLELWYVWLGNDEEDIIEKTYGLRELTEEALNEIFLDDDNDYKIIITR